MAAAAAATSTIVEGQQYALTSQFGSGKGQSMVFVKLTDSALKAIEDYAASVAKGNVSPNFKPSIELRTNNSQGVITVPSRVNNNNNNNNADTTSATTEKQSFNFSLKDIQNDGILECIRQDSHNRSMESLGKVALRMQIHANDDSYRNTKVKMAVAAEQELKKYNTKVIQSSDPNVGRKVKVKRPFGGGPGGGGGGNSKSSSSYTTPSASSSLNASSSSMYTKQTPPLAASMPRFNKFHSVNNGVGSGGGGKSNYHNGGGGTTSGNSSSSSTNTSPQLSEATKKIIREHLIHLLAVRPYKTAELLCKMQEKAKDADKNALLTLVNGIATNKDGFFHLTDTAWEEVQLDWLQYSKEDRDMVHKRNPLMQTTDTTTATTNHNNNKFGGSGNNPSSISPLSDSSSIRSNNCSPNSVGVASPTTLLKNSPYNHHHNNHNNSQHPQHSHNHHHQNKVMNVLKRNSDNGGNGGVGGKKFKNDNLRPSTLTVNGGGGSGNGKGLSSSTSSSSSGSASIHLSANNQTSTTNERGSSSSSHHLHHSSNSPMDKNFINNNHNDSESPDGRNFYNNSNGNGNTSTNNCYNNNKSLSSFHHHHQNQQHHNNHHEGLSSSSSSSHLMHNKKNNDLIATSDVSNARNHHNHHHRHLTNGSGNGSGSINSTPNSSPDSGLGNNNNNNSNNNIGSDSGDDDFHSKYKKIQSIEQLEQYKHDFDSEYPEYKRTFTYIDSVTRQFDELHEMILTKEEDSEEWQELVRLTVEKYDEVKHRSRFNYMQKKLRHLHYKLLHIKNLITDYYRERGGGGGVIPQNVAATSAAAGSTVASAHISPLIRSSVK